MAKAESPRTDHRQITKVMTRDPTCCLPSDSAQAVARIMLEKDVGAVPIIDNHESRKLVGIVTDRDLCLGVIAAGRDLHAPVEDCMTPKTVSCHPEDPVNKAVDLMEENQVRRIPVVDQANRIRGILSLGDVVRRSQVDGGTTREVLERISEPSGQASKPRADARMPMEGKDTNRRIRR